MISEYFYRILLFFVWILMVKVYVFIDLFGNILWEIILIYLFLFNIFISGWRVVFG